MADLARIEERIDRVAVSTMEVSDALGGIRFQNMVEVMEFAKCMAIADTAVPKHLRGNVGMCLAVCVQALEWRFSPFAVANKSYVVNDRIGYESQLVHAVIEQRAPITGRLRHTFDGEGDNRRCIVSATLKDTGEKLEYISPPFGKIQPKNSPLWKSKPDLQLYYNTSRDFCRAYFPDVLLGVYSADELRDHVGPDNAKDVSKPDLASRLKKGGRGFSADHVERESRGGVIEESQANATEGKAGMAGVECDPVRRSTAGTGLQVGAADAVQPATSELMDVTAGETAPHSNSSEPDLPKVEAQASEPAEDIPPSSAGEIAESAPPSLPEGTLILYAAALRRAQKKESLAKYAKQFWDQHGGWEGWKDTQDGATAAAIFTVFRDNFGNREQIELQLRELI